MESAAFSPHPPCQHISAKTRVVSEALYPAVPSLDGPHAQQRRAHAHVSELLARVRPARLRRAKHTGLSLGGACHRTHAQRFCSDLPPYCAQL